MNRVRRVLSHLLLAALLLAAAVVPAGDAQVPGTQYCPPGDQGDQSPTAVTPTKPYLDLTPTRVSLRLASQDATERGVYLITPTSGQGDVTFDVKNIGTASPGGTTQARLTLTRPSGGTLVRTLDLNVPGAGATTTTTTTFTLEPGRHTLKIEVNPAQSPAESCTDSAANTNCGTATDPCTTTYTANNEKSVGLLIGQLPALSVEAIAATSPTRATYGPSADSEARVDVTIRNEGAVHAFNLDALGIGAAPFAVRIEVPGCDCEPRVRNVESITPGGWRIVTATFPLHGLKDQFEVKVLLDPDQKTGDLSRQHATRAATFRLPTAHLSGNLTTEHEREGATILVPTGSPLIFNVQVTNSGDAAARNTNGTGFLVTVHRDNDNNLIHQERITVGAGATRTLTVSDNAANLTGRHLYRVRIDALNEVLESTKTGNIIDFRAAVALYEAKLTVDAARYTVPPGIGARVPFTIQNTGTVTDTYLLVEDAAQASTVRYEAQNGTAVQEVLLAPGAKSELVFVREIPRDAKEGDELQASIHARSKTTTTATTKAITFTVGPDDVAPKIELVSPASGYLRDDRIVLRVEDNVAVELVETDLAGSLQKIEPDIDGGHTYTLDARGTPTSFTLQVRAKDIFGNTAERSFTIIRDTSAPRISAITFNPPSVQGGRGIAPGSLVNLQIDARDANMDRVDIQVRQVRPSGLYTENLSLRGAGPLYFLQDWRVPDRAGHYVFNITAHDKAGNTANREVVLYVQGLNIRIVSNAPQVTPQTPRAGEPVRFSYVIENTSPRHETGPFFVTFVLDFQRQIGAQRVNLPPGGREIVHFTWTATAGQHSFAFVVDQAEEVAEDCEGEICNLLLSTTDLLFPDQPLFAPEMVRVRDFDTFGDRVLRYWFVPVLFIAVAGLFAVAVHLARREQES